MSLLDLQKPIRQVLWAGFAGYAFLALLYFAYRAHSNHLIILSLAVSLVLACGFLLYWLRQREFDGDIDADLAARTVQFLVAAGLIIRVLFVVLIPPVQQSDFLAYLDVAQRLVNEGRYYFPSPSGDLLAWRPPGYPLLLAALMLVFGKASWLPLAINLVCFAATCFAVRALVDRLIGNRLASLFAVLLMVLWPDAIAGVGYAASEWPSLALLTTGVWAILAAQEGSWRHAVLAGICMGYLALIRPGLMLLPFCWFIFFAAGRPFDRARLATNLIALIMTVAVIAPWSIRNYHVLHAFVPISTNGGSVFYRANNPLADGGYTPRGARDIDALMGNEVLWNRTGFAWGMEWIRSNPIKFLTLLLKKQAIFTGDDTNSIYWAVERAYNDTGLGYSVFQWVANSWWVGVLLLIAVASIRRRRRLYGDPGTALLVATILYVVAVHSVFESQPRHHQPLYGLLAVLATMAVWRPSAVGKEAVQR